MIRIISIYLKLFFTAKSLHSTVIKGQIFELLYKDKEDDEDWNEFDDINKLIIRRIIRIEYTITYPHLYSDRPC